jgi:hypothetical protein
MTPAEIIQIVIGVLSLFATVFISFFIYWLQTKHKKDTVDKKGISEEEIEKIIDKVLKSSVNCLLFDDCLFPCSFCVLFDYLNSQLVAYYIEEDCNQKAHKGVRVAQVEKSPQGKSDCDCPQCKYGNFLRSHSCSGLVRLFDCDYFCDIILDVVFVVAVCE